jgi:3-oxoacyl-[acyl-carrier-protein] synthase II
MTGHLMGATGAVEAIAAIMAINHGKIPPTINQFERDAQIDPRLNLTPNKSIDLNVRAVLNNTFGFGGHIVTTLFRRFEY